MPVVNDYTALLSGSYWGGIESTGQPVIVTFSFPTAAPAYDSSIGGFTASTVASFQAFSAAEQQQALSALGEWAKASSITFVEVAPGHGDINFQKVDFDTTFGPSYSGDGGIGFYPFGNWNFFSYPSFSNDLDSSGDVFMNTRFETGGGASATVNYGTLLHEIGHAIGLKHPTEVVTDFAADPDVTHDQVLSSDDPLRTIMATVGGGTGHLMSLDKTAAAFIYGADITGKPDVVTASTSATYSVAQNHSVASWNWNASTQTLTETGRATDDVIRGTSVSDVINGGDGNDRLFGLAGNDTLNGGNGNDALFGGSGADRMVGGDGDDSYFVDDAGAVIVESLNKGYDSVYATVSFTLKANFEVLQLFGNGLTGKGSNDANSIFGDGAFGNTLYGLNGNDYMVGGSGVDTLYGGNNDDTLFGQDGNDKLLGSAGRDILVGGLGKDTLTGGADADVFRFTNINESGTTTTTRDIITDFKDHTAASSPVDADTIDLSAINSGAANGSFIFIDTAAFSHTAGELRWQQFATMAVVSGDTNGDAIADFTIQLTGAHTLHNWDFNL